jgi:hypothetical protein
VPQPCCSYAGGAQIDAKSRAPLARQRRLEAVQKADRADVALFEEDAGIR